MNAIAIGLAFGLAAHAQTLATVGGTKITVDDFQKRLGEVRAKVVTPPSNEDFLEDLIRYEIGLQEARRLKLPEDPVIKERFDQVLYNSLLEKELGPKLDKVTVREPEMKTFYRSNPELHLAHILIDVKEDASVEDRAAARRRAQENLDEVRRSRRPFDELVKLYSDDPTTKDNAGDLGYQSRATLAPEIYDLALKMTPGQIKGPIESRDGFHILKLIDRRPYDLADKRQVRSALIDHARVELFNDFFARLKSQKDHRVEINKEALRSLQ